MFGFFSYPVLPIPSTTKMEERIFALETKLKEAREMLEQIVVTDGTDKGVILKDTESPTYYEPKVESMVYIHQYFSQLGDALIELHEKLKDDHGL